MNFATAMQSIVVRPASAIVSDVEAARWFTPVGFANTLYEDDPTRVNVESVNGIIDAEFEPTFIAAPCCEDPENTCGFQTDPPIRTLQSLRFHSPYYGLTADRKIFDSETGSYFCIRSSKYYLRVRGSVFRGWSEPQECTGEGKYNVECGIKITVYLIDQNFDNSALCWNTRDDIPLTGFKLVCNLVASVGYQTGFVHLDKYYVVELPDLADGSGPPKIYGAYAEIEQSPVAGFQNETGWSEVTLLAYQEDARRYRDAESGELLPPNSPSPSYSRMDPGYVGEWEEGEYKPPVPFVYRIESSSAVQVPKNTTTEPLPFIVTDANQVDSTLTILKSSNPSHGVIDGSSWAMTYTPTPGYTGWDSFLYSAQNAAGRYAYRTARMYLYVY